MQQTLVIAALDDAAVVQNDDLVGFNDRREAVSDDQAGVVPGDFPQPVT